MIHTLSLSLPSSKLSRQTQTDRNPNPNFKNLTSPVGKKSQSLRRECEREREEGRIGKWKKGKREILCWPIGEVDDASGKGGSVWSERGLKISVISSLRLSSLCTII